MCVEGCDDVYHCAERRPVTALLFNTRTSSIGGCVLGLLAAGAFICALEAQQPSAALPTETGAHRDVINRYCVSCHNDRVKTGGLALDTVASHEVGEHSEVWEKVLRKVRVRQM